MKCQWQWVAIAVLVFSPSLADGRDWFVRAGSAGNGTKESPFKDPYLALEEAGPGDTIHVAQGVYHGKLNAANWVVATPNLTWLGGYNDDFSKRDPWHFPSELRFSSVFRGHNSGTLIEGRGSHENFVIDGFVMDQKERNEYGHEPYSSLSGSGPSSDPLLRLSAPGTQIRNCLILNGAHGGVDLSGDGCRIENSIIMNMYAGPLVDYRSHGQQAAVFKGNTFLFSWSDSGVRSGGTPAGCGVSFWECNHEVEFIDNIFVGCDNPAVKAGAADKLSLTRNVFWLNGWLNVDVHAKAQEVRVDNSNMGDLDDAGLKACQGNLAANPELTGLDPKWMEIFFDRVAEDYSDLTLEDLNQMRRSVGLAALTEKKAQSRVSRAMAYDATQALKIVPAKLKQGAHPVALEVGPFSSPPPTVTYQYERTTWRTLMENPASLDGKRVEVVAAMGQEYSMFPFHGITGDEYRGFELHDAQEQIGLTPVIYIKKGTKAERAIEDVIPWDGRGTPAEKYLVRGLAKYDAAATISRKGTILVDSVTPVVETVVVERTPRPVGRDWFVRAGSSGDGSKEQPFKDPWQALDAAQRGDAIHVAEGEYFGRFKSGSWKIKTQYLSLLGGYDKDFKERDPWKRPTRLGYTPGTSGGGSSPYIIGEEDHTGFIFDGFVLDGRDINRLDSNGNLIARFPGEELITLSSPDAVVRNCILVNASAAAIRASGDNTEIENNIILNSNYHAIDTASRPAQPLVIRNNTILFTWWADRDRPDVSKVAAIHTFQGTVLDLENNIIGYCDGNAIRATPLKGMKIVNNVFTHNRFASFSDGDKIYIDDSTMNLMNEVGFGAAAGNLVLDPQMPLDKKWWAEYSRTDGPVFFARPYDWKAAVNLVPQNPTCKAGARPLKLEVHFNQGSSRNRVGRK